MKKYFTLFDGSIDVDKIMSCIVIVFAVAVCLFVVVGSIHWHANIVDNITSIEPATNVLNTIVR